MYVTHSSLHFPSGPQTMERSFVQKNAMIVWEKRIDFKDVLLNDETVSTLFTREELEKLFDMQKIKYSVDKIFKKIGLV